ncbi:MAG: HEAT repeat domain-containing protein [Desulfobacteraceae bacterium]|nr:MAG: HEAT repeat domain-containing protein [Desulfobacteraceae bacterium]
MNVLVDKADDAVFQKFVGRITQMVDTVSKNPQDAGPRIVSNRQLSSLVKSIKTAQMISGSTQASAAGEDLHLTAEKKRAGQLASALKGILKCQPMVSHERVMLDRMDETVRNLLANQKYATVVTLFGQLGNLLQNKDSEIRTIAATLLANIDEQFESAGCLKERIALSLKMLEWIQSETEYSPVYEKISARLQRLTRLLIEKKCFNAAGHILKVEFSISNGSIPKNSEIRGKALKFLKNIAKEDILNLYLQEIQSGGAIPGEDDIQSFVILGSVNVDRLLDLLHDSHSRSERNCIVRVVSRIGMPAAGPVVERIQRGGPWFYVRNLTLLLGRIGDESHLKILESLLKDKNVRIQREGILAIQNIGGDAAAKLLYENLHTVDDELKGAIFTFIGNLKYRAATADMIGMLESGALGRTKKDKIDIMVKICEAFGRMAEGKAVPVLKRVTRTKGFLTKVYDPMVRAAAEEALRQIETAGASSG